jgi:protein-disulfide isomerase
MTEHVRGEGRVELTEFGDFECPYCRDAAPAIARVLARLDGRVRLRFRHFPVTDRHPHAERAAEAAEAAAAQGRFWEMHDLLFAHQRALEDDDLIRYAAELGLDADRFADDLHSGRLAPEVLAEREEGIALGVAGTPAFFIDGERYDGFYDVEALVDALEDAGA